ncbi:MAG: type I restriction endonuclease subunit R [Chloroflexi bacterium]|nr:type I restriction endonuclease subunit R [Chloroflexota bacterium]
MVDTSEKNFEATIEAHLLNVNGYERRTAADYDAELCLIPDDVIRFVQSTQPTEWAKLRQQYGEAARSKFLYRLCEQIEKRSTLDVLRKGFKDVGARFQLVFFRPASGLNAETQRLYAANIFSVVRQLYFSQKDRKSLDLAIFINGLPVFTAELKNPFTAQTVQNAMRQYRRDRDPREPLFAFGRCLIHFAVDPDLIYMTSRLDGEKTFFLPFNRGRSNGAGNPPRHDTFATAYLWEDIWTKDSVLNLLDQFVQVVEVEDDKGKKTGEKRLIIPRYHQLDAVRRLIVDARERGPGQRYLIQHSAGSGKSFSIAWLAHQLSTLHNDHDERVFDSVIVITDRRILDRQLQHTMRQFEQVMGTVENIDATSRQLRQALEDGKQIIVTTLQKFPMIVAEVGQLQGKRFAIIIDEAHSSQSGESVKSLKAVLQTSDLDEAEAEEGDADPPDYEDVIVEEMRKRKHQPNTSTFAFTATPKSKTLELFGTKRPDGKYEAFSLYSMRQAIEEGFILDVLESYITYKAYWRLLKTIEDDPQYESGKAKSLLRRFVDLHRHTIDKKIEIMVEHFHNHIAHQIGGKAKAMIVTRSRLHAVRYFLALRSYLAKSGHPYQAMVAFSGAVKDGAGSYTESGLNGFPETQTAEMFKRDEYRFLVVANKFQTGFDQPLLHTMYVDKLLSSVHAVQTLSRLNRTHPGKSSTCVLDFANDADHIQAAFAPYYERTLLSESTDPNLLYDRETELKSFELFTDAEVDHFARLYFTPGTTQDRLHTPLDPVVERFNDLSEEAQGDFRSKLMDYIRQYAFLSQILPFEDADLEKLYVFAKFLRRKLPIERDELPLEVLQSIDIESYRIRQTGSGNYTPDHGDPNLDPLSGVTGRFRNDDPREALSRILQELNERFGVELTEADRVTIEYVQEQIAQSGAVSDSLRVNPIDKVRLTFEHVAGDVIQDVYKSNFNFYRLVSDNESFRDALFTWLFERYLESKAS